MQIQSNSSMFISTDSQPPPKPQAGERPPGPPPPSGPGGMPPGLGAAIGTLSTEERESVQEMLQSLTGEQKGQLKQALDEFKSEADTMSIKDIGQSFFDILSSVANPGSASNSQSTVTADNQVDIYV